MAAAACQHTAGAVAARGGRRRAGPLRQRRTPTWTASTAGARGPVGWRRWRTAPRRRSCVSSDGTTGPAGGTAVRWRWPAAIPKRGRRRADRAGRRRARRRAGSPRRRAALRRAADLLDVRRRGCAVRLALGVGRTGDGHRRRRGCRRPRRARDASWRRSSARHATASNPTSCWPRRCAVTAASTGRDGWPTRRWQTRREPGSGPAELGVGLPAGRHRQREPLRRLRSLEFATSPLIRCGGVAAC